MNPIFHCGAKRRDGGSCTRPKMRGSKRCSIHGGKSPWVVRAAARTLAEERATKAIKAAHLPPVDDPVGELRALAAEALALKDYFRERVDSLQELRYQAGVGEQIRGELVMFERALDRSAKFCESLARLGLEDRAVRIDEARVVLLVAVLQRVLSAPELGLDSARQMAARTLLVEALEAAP